MPLSSIFPTTMNNQNEALNATPTDFSWLTASFRMVQLVVVYGEWAIQDKAWQFVVDNLKGGRLLFLSDDCTHCELLEMVKDEYKLESYLVEITYSLPESMLQHMAPDTPPMHVTNDRQVKNLIELSRAHVIRLCVSSRLEMGCDVNNDFDGVLDSGFEEYIDVDAEVCEDGDGDESVFDTGNGDEEDHVIEDGEGQDEDIKIDGVGINEDYSAYGKVKDEDEDDISFDGVGGSERCFGEGTSSKTTWSDGILVGQSFHSKDELLRELRLTAVMSRFAFKTYKSTKTLLVTTCRVKGCKWKVRACVTNEPNRFWVTKYIKKHTCSLADRVAHRKRSTPKYIGRLFIERVGIIDGVTPKHIQHSMKVMFGMNLDYSTSYRSLIYAQELVRGTAEHGYENLPSYLHMIKKANPGTLTALEVDAHNRFKYLFISFGASIAGFQYLRRVIVVDGTHLSGKHEGVLLVAAAQDGNFQIFPLAFGIVDAENDASWQWFFTKLKGCISDQYALTIVSDRHGSIKKACETVFPWATRGICYYHLQCNIVTKFRGKQLMYLVKGAAYAYTLDEYDRYMDLIRRVKPEIATYLEEADPKLWSRVHFEGDRYNIKTSNIAESINAALKVARGFPISFLLEFIREKLGRWFCIRREDALSLTTRHTRAVEYLLAVRDDYASRMKVERINDLQFHVKGGARDCIVDLGQNKCTCGVFNIEKIPCSHAIAALVESKQDVATGVCPTYGRDYLYWTYAESIFPKNPDDECIASTPCLPPHVKTRPGRKKNSRWQTWLEIARIKGTKPRKIHAQYNCSKCNQPGHTKPNCGT